MVLEKKKRPKQKDENKKIKQKTNLSEKVLFSDNSIPFLEDGKIKIPQKGGRKKKKVISEKKFTDIPNKKKYFSKTHLFFSSSFSPVYFQFKTENLPLLDHPILSDKKEKKKLLMKKEENWKKTEFFSNSIIKTELFSKKNNPYFFTGKNINYFPEKIKKSMEVNRKKDLFFFSFFSPAFFKTFLQTIGIDSSFFYSSSGKLRLQKKLNFYTESFPFQSPFLITNLACWTEYFRKSQNQDWILLNLVETLEAVAKNCFFLHQINPWGDNYCYFRIFTNKIN